MQSKYLDIDKKMNLTLEEAAIYSNIGINKLRELSKDANCLFVLKVGNKTLIKRKEFEEWNSEQYYI